MHDLLNFLLLFEFHYKACYFQNEKLLTLCCVAHWLLISFFGNFPYFWKSKSMIHTEIFYKIMLIRIPGLKNDSCIFFSSLKFLYLDFLRGHGGTTTWTIFMCNLFSSCYRWDLTGRLSLETACSFKVLFPPPHLSNEISPDQSTLSVPTRVSQFW